MGHNTYGSRRTPNTVVAPHILAGLLIMNAVLQLADAWSTFASLLDGGSEYNFVSRWIMAEAGLGAWAAIKIAIAALFIGIYFWTRNQDEATQKQVEIVALAGVAWMTFVVQSNVQRFYG